MAGWERKAREATGSIPRLGTPVHERKETFVRFSNKQLRGIRRKGTKTWCFVYGLKDPETGATCYIGQTRCLPKTRLKFHYKSLDTHLARGRKLYPVMVWLKALRDKGLKLQLDLIDDRAIWDVTEAVWIDRMTRGGIQLLNVGSRVP